MIIHTVHKNALYLLYKQDVCCSCEHKEVVYTKKTGFRCCGHLYFNTSLWSCCAGKLSPVHQPGQHQSNMIEGQLCNVWTQNSLMYVYYLSDNMCVSFSESRLLSMNNLNETHLCENSKISVYRLEFLWTNMANEYMWICFLSLFSTNRDFGTCVSAKHRVQQCAENLWKKCHYETSALTSHPEKIWSLQLPKTDPWEDLLLWWS